MSYVIQPGDTLLAIAKRFTVSPQAIVAANHLTNQDSLVAGETLQIPAAPVVHLTITPADATAGNSFHFAVDGAQPSETVTFEIARPDGKTFTGPPHLAGAQGTVSASYQTGASDPPGTYTVTATGDQNTTAAGTFLVEPPRTTTTGG